MYQIIFTYSFVTGILISITIVWILGFFFRQRFCGMECLDNM